MRQQSAQQNDGVTPKSTVHEGVDKDVHEAVAVGEPHEGEADLARDGDVREERQEDNQHHVRSPRDEVDRGRDAKHLDGLQVPGL